MAEAICLNCGFRLKVNMALGLNTKNSENHHIVLIAKGNIIEGIKAEV